MNLLIWNIIIGLVFIVSGIYFMLKPKRIWNATEHRLSYFGDEPSKLSLMLIRIVGILFLAIGIAIIYFSVL